MQSTRIRQREASFNGVILNSARVEGNIQMDGARLEVDLNGDALQVGGSVLMDSAHDRGVARFKGVTLVSARIVGNLSMDGAAFGGDLIASSVQVGASIFMRSTAEYRANFQALNLKGAG